MTDGIFIINSALNVKQLSVFNSQQRFDQTVETIKSIDKYCPNNIKYIFDGSPEISSVEYIKELEKMGVNFFYTGNNQSVKQLSIYGKRSLAESLGFILFLDYFSKNKVNAKRIYKISGRYKINDNFIKDRDDFQDAFVFSPPLDSWMPALKQEASGTNKLFRLRMWHMDYSLLDTFISKMPRIFNDCMNHDIDVEHSYYKNLNMHKCVTVEKIGVEGAIAPTGEYINE